jgi:LPS-assembly protein
MFRLVSLVLLSFTLLLSSDKVEIFATDIYTIDEILHAEGEVSVVYRDYYISAKKAKYDKQSGVLELYENVRATQANSYKILGEYARINLQNKQRVFKPFYMLEQQSEVWMSAADAKTDEKYIDIDGGVISGCDPSKPLWKMEFSSSDYNQDTKWLNTYNNRLYIYDILVFYTPYFGYSLDRTRRTGFLLPSLGISNDEGFYYEQPFYIAEQNWWDLELKPQLRTQRGRGLYSEFRFVDSKVSRGSLILGGFKEYDEYFEETGLVNQEHYGFDFKYANSDFLNQWFGSSLRGQSDIYLDLIYMNDVDYVNLATNDTTVNATSQQILSRVNMFYNNEKNYYASYIKYYQDLTLEDNSRTLQQLPSLHYHHYLETLFKNHLLYNLDVKSTNIYRQEGIGVLQTDIDLPITIQTSLFDEYLNIAYKNFFYTQLSQFRGFESTDNKDDYENGHFLKNYSVLQLNTSLTKAFTNYTHVVNLGAKYSFAGVNGMSGYYKDHEDKCFIANNSQECEFYNVSDSTRDFNVEFSQFLYNRSGAEKLYHKLTQNIIYKDNLEEDEEESDEEFGELESELRLNIANGFNVYNNTFYNHYEKDFSKVVNQITYGGHGFNLSLSHLFENKFHEEGVNYTTEPYTSYLTSNLSYKYDEHYSYKIVYNFDLQTKLKKNLELGFLYQKRCWDFGLRYVENNRPILSNNGQDYNSIYDRYLYFTILLKPFMESNANTSSLSYKLPETHTAGE